MHPCLNTLEIKKGFGMSYNRNGFGSELQAFVFVPIPSCFILATYLFFDLRLEFWEFKGMYYIIGKVFWRPSQWHITFSINLNNLVAKWKRNLHLAPPFFSNDAWISIYTPPSCVHTWTSIYAPPDLRLCSNRVPQVKQRGQGMSTFTFFYLLKKSTTYWGDCKKHLSYFLSPCPSMGVFLLITFA